MSSLSCARSCGVQVAETLVKIHEKYRLACAEWRDVRPVPLTAVREGILAGTLLDSSTITRIVALYELTPEEAAVCRGAVGLFHLQGIVSHVSSFTMAERATELS